MFRNSPADRSFRIPTEAPCALPNCLAGEAGRGPEAESARPQMPFGTAGARVFRLKRKPPFAPGLAISESVLSVFRALQPVLRAGEPAKGHGRSFRLAGGWRVARKGDSAVRRGRCVGKAGLALVPASPLSEPVLSVFNGLRRHFDSGAGAARKPPALGRRGAGPGR